MNAILYNIKDVNKEKGFCDICKSLKITPVKLDGGDVDEEISTLIGISIPGTVKRHAIPPVLYSMPEVLIFSGLSDAKLDEFLAAYRNSGLEAVALRAVVTPFNVSWTIFELCEELKKEHLKFSKEI